MESWRLRSRPVVSAIEIISTARNEQPRLTVGKNKRAEPCSSALLQHEVPSFASSVSFYRSVVGVVCDLDHLEMSTQRGLLTPGRKVNECYWAWVLKNSRSRSSQKFHRARMPYKRPCRFWWTFSIPPPGRFFRKRGFFNSHGRYRQLSKMENKLTY